MEDTLVDEKIGVKKIRLERPGKGAMAVVGSFATADNFLTAWWNASHGWLKCRFEVEYLDEHVIKGEYKPFRKKTGRVSLSLHIRSTFRKMLKQVDLADGGGAKLESAEIQLLVGNSAQAFDTDFLERYETEDNAGR